MNDDQKSDLLLAVLAMDSYNQGYDAGLAHGETQVGSATKFTPDGLDDSGWQAASFYAAACDTPDGIVISYRGTNDFSLNPFSASDIFNGWVARQRLWQ